ncbi:MAG TPA: hypothetical protein VGI90_05930 [Steroidobacteraceae bacterium]
MRLLDMVVQSRDPFIVLPPTRDARQLIVSSPGDFAQSLVQCPQRYVLADDLTRACAELAFADGDRLVGCLDLIRIPAPSLWIEWSDSVHQEVIARCGVVAQEDPAAFGRRVGLLLQATPCGRAAVARTFWSAWNAGENCAQMSPLEIHIHLDEEFEPTGEGVGIFSGGYARLMDAHHPSVGDLLDRVRFRFDHKWSRYYEAAASDAATRSAVMRNSLAAVAHDVPLLLAFFLLLNAKGATRPLPVSRSILNRKRLARDRAPLLDHIEVHASLPPDAPGFNNADADNAGTRRPPRLHHVRGHLVRREDRVFWRTPHLRGNALQGVVRSRTVCLSFARAGGLHA